MFHVTSNEVTKSSWPFVYLFTAKIYTFAADFFFVLGEVREHLLFSFFTHLSSHVELGQKIKLEPLESCASNELLDLFSSKVDDCEVKINGGIKDIYGSSVHVFLNLELSSKFKGA